MNSNNPKHNLIHFLNYYSKYYCRTFIECENLFELQKGHFALFNLLTLFENICKSKINDYEITFNNLNIKLEKEGFISEAELKFINDNEVGLRKIRNILAHANLSKYDLEINSEPITYPFTENETCLKIYNDVSEIICEILLKILSKEKENSINIDDKIGKLNYRIITRKPEELMVFKGLDLKEEFDELDESSKYRLLENSENALILAEIFKGLKL